MARNAKPIELIVLEGKTHLTKEQIEHRKKSEIRFGTPWLVCPDFIKDDPVAMERWGELLELYHGVSFISSSDSGIVARYCKTHSDYLRLLGKQAECEDPTVYLKYAAVIKQTADQLQKMEDRLFLSPLSKVKNIPKKEEEKVDILASKGFDNV